MSEPEKSSSYEEAVRPQMRREYQSVSSMNAFEPVDSPSRKQMFGSHLGQFLVIENPTEKFIVSGTERQYAKATFDVRMPVTGRVIQVIDLYPPRPGMNNIAINPLKVMVFEDVETKEVGCVELPLYCQNHQYFGHPYKQTEAYGRIRPGEEFKKDTIFLRSPTITDNGDYRYGRELNIAYMSIPGVSEDGIAISRDVLPHFRFRMYKHRVVQFGRDLVPMNIYGTIDKPKIFPDIGDAVRPDGLLMALRKYDPDLAGINMDAQSMMEPDVIYDKLVYTEPSKELRDITTFTSGRVVDIRIYHDSNNNPGPTPPELEAQALKYDNARRQFFQEVHALERKLLRDPRGAVQFSNEFHDLCRQAISTVGCNTMEKHRGKSVKPLHRKAPLDEWYIEFVIEYIHTPSKGYKLTGSHGNKGVIVKIMEPEEMPLEIRNDGLPPKRADIVMDGYSSVNRIIPGCMFEQYINAAHQDIVAYIKYSLQFSPTDVLTHKYIVQRLRDVRAQNPVLYDTFQTKVLMYYSIHSPTVVWPVMHDLAEAQPDEFLDHLAILVKSGGIHTFLQPESPAKPLAITKALRKHLPPHIGKVTYIGNSGRRVITKYPHLIGSAYFIILEKIPDDWCAVASGKVQHFGILSQVTAADKYSQPVRGQPVRLWDESTTRNGVSYITPEGMAEIIDRNNSPMSHRLLIRNILDADDPIGVKQLIDRTVVPLGDARPNKIAEHVMQCGGIQFEWGPEQEISDEEV